jgi:Ricin-type beta-trefoil lectin domain-like
MKKPNCLRAFYTVSATVVIACCGITAANAASMAIDSLSGAVTQNEINSFKAFMATQVPPQTPWGDLNGTGHNAWADGPGGNNLEAMGLMYEVSGDIGILTNLIGWTDICVSQRNDLLAASKGGQRVMWTGRVNKVWVPNDPTSSSATYAGGENGDTKAHIAYTALLILQQPWLWGQTVPDGDPKGYGSTYLARAQTYIRRCDEGHDDYDHIFYTSGNLIRNPSNWPSGFHTMEAINIQMMLMGYLERIAQCHEILNDNPSRVSTYDTVVKTAGRECLNGMKHSSTVNGQTVYKWGYYPWSTSFNESVGHAAYDVVGIWRIYNRSSYGFSLSEVAPIANAAVDVIEVGANTFSGNVDGSGGTQNYMQAQWLLAADWNSSVYDDYAAADVASGRYKSTTLMDATILWMKQRRYFQANQFEFQNVNSAMAMNVSGAVTTNGGKIIQWPFGGSANSLWTFKQGAAGSYLQIVNINSGKDVAVQSASTNNAAAIVQWTFGSGRNDLWLPVKNSDSTYSFYNMKSGKIFEVPGNSTAQGTQLDQWSDVKHASQKWNLIAQ